MSDMGVKSDSLYPTGIVERSRVNNKIKNNIGKHIDSNSRHILSNISIIYPYILNHRYGIGIGIGKGKGIGIQSYSTDLHRFQSMEWILHQLYSNK